MRELYLKLRRRRRRRTTTDKLTVIDITVQARQVCGTVFIFYVIIINSKVKL